MSAENMSASPQSSAGNAARRLTSGRVMDWVSLGMGILTVAGLIRLDLSAASHIFLLLALLVAGMQKYYALRVAFDARTFADWARQWATPNAMPPEIAMAEFDRKLAALHLRPATAGTRPLTQRIAGAKLLWHRQALCLLFQTLLLFCALIAHIATE